MRKILFFWVFMFLCVSCSDHDFVEEYEKKVSRDTVNIIESGDSNCDTLNDSTVNDGTVKFRTFSVLGNSISQRIVGIFQMDMQIIILQVDFQ